jgi:hypothetical protein
LQSDEGVGDAQLLLEDRVALRELDVESLGLRKLRLPTGLLRCKPGGPMSTEVRAPGGQQRAVDALPSKQRAESASLAAGQAAIGFLHDAQLVGCAEHSTETLRHRLQRTVYVGALLNATIRRGVLV